MVELIEIGVLSALGAWVFTQFHLILAVKRIKKDIDTKREATETFVDERLAKLEANVGGFEARMTAQMPPNVHGELEDVRAEIQEINVGLRKEFEELPLRIRQAYGGVKGGEFIRSDKVLEGVAEEAKAFAIAEYDPQDAMQRQAIEWINRPISKKATELEQMAAIGAKKFLSEFLIGRQGSPGTSVTYRVSKSPYGL